MSEPWKRREVIGDATLYLGDCLEILPHLPKVDAVITDPPYGIEGGNGHINLARGKGNYSTIFEDTENNALSVTIPAITICIDNCDCVVVTPGTRVFRSYPQPDSFGCFYQPAATGMQVFGFGDAQPIFYYGNNATKKNMGKSCSFLLTEAAEVNGHPCPKPIKAWTKLLESVTLKEQSVLDPFMGSGTTGVACMNLGRKFIGIEIEPKYFNIACERIENAQRQAKLFEPAAAKPEQLTL